jgi:hypothetical protein
MKFHVLLVNAVEKLNDEACYNFCQDNPTLYVERDAQGQIMIVPLRG